MRLFWLNWSRKDWFVFIIGLFSMIKFRLLGTFALSEIIIFITYLFIGFRTEFTNNKRMNYLFFLAILWCVGVFISDRINDINLNDSLKGAFNVIFIILLIPFVYWMLEDRPQRMILFWIGNGLSSIFAFYFQRIDLYNEIDANIWRVYAFYPAAIALSGLLYYKGRVITSCLLIEMFAFWSLFNMSRNVFLSMTCGVCLILFINWIGKYSVDRIEMYKKKSLSLLIVFGLSLIGISFTYEYLVKNKILGEPAYRKYIMQKYAKGGIASGRLDAFQSLYLISENPIIGYGSYAKDKEGLIRQFDKGTNRDRNDYLPGHSYILGAWVYSGVLGAIFWMYILYLIFVFIKDKILIDSRLIGINALLTFQMIWNILFSPFANRLNFLFFIILIIVLIDLEKSEYESETSKNIGNCSFV